jgi:hypothetical protein
MTQMNLARLVFCAPNLVQYDSMGFLLVFALGFLLKKWAEKQLQQRNRNFSTFVAVPNKTTMYFFTQVNPVHTASEPTNTTIPTLVAPTVVDHRIQ